MKNAISLGATVKGYYGEAMISGVVVTVDAGGFVVVYLPAPIVINGTTRKEVGFSRWQVSALEVIKAAPELAEGDYGDEQGVWYLTNAKAGQILASM